MWCNQSQKNDYDSHMVFVHGDGFECQHCGKIMTYKRNVKKRVKNIHLQEFLYCCTEEDCDYATDAKAAYQSHLISTHDHEQTVEYRCAICDKNFSAKYLLDKHNKNTDCSTIMKNFECTQCDPPRPFKYKKSVERQ